VPLPVPVKKHQLPKLELPLSSQSPQPSGMGRHSLGELITDSFDSFSESNHNPKPKSDRTDRQPFNTRWSVDPSFGSLNVQRLNLPPVTKNSETPRPREAAKQDLQRLMQPLYGTGYHIPQENDQTRQGRKTGAQVQKVSDLAIGKIGQMDRVETTMRFAKAAEDQIKARLARVNEQLNLNLDGLSNQGKSRSLSRLRDGGAQTVR